MQTARRSEPSIRWRECSGFAPCIAEICGNSIDDDGDGMFDCADPECGSAAGCDEPPPDLRTIAPPNNPSVPTTLFDSMAFLYAGASPVQYFVDPATIVPERAAVIRGHVAQ